MPEVSLLSLKQTDRNKHLRLIRSKSAKPATVQSVQSSCLAPLLKLCFFERKWGDLMVSWFFLFLFFLSQMDVRDDIFSNLK